METRRTEPYLSTYLHSRGGKLGLPIGGTFELTARCNFRCPMCYVHLDQACIDARGRELTAQQWISLAREAADEGMVFALLTGGEPFLRKDFFQIYDAMKDMGLMISINSNGSLLDGEIRRRLLDNPPFRLNVSLYGGCPETYRSMCGQDAFHRVVENVRAVKEAGVDVRLNLSITPHNQQDLEKIFAVSRDLDVHIKGTSYMYPSVRVNGDQYGQGDRLSPEDAAACAVRWDRIRMSREEFGMRAQRLRALKAAEMSDCGADLDEGVRCRAGRSSFWMTWDGKMHPCGMMSAPTAHPLDTGFRAAWDQIRTETEKIRTPSKCAACPKREACGVCAAMCLTETGSFQEVPEYMCRYTDALIDHAWQASQAEEENGNGD